MAGCVQVVYHCKPKSCARLIPCLFCLQAARASASVADAKLAQALAAEERARSMEKGAAQQVAEAQQVRVSCVK